jgi:hypothetical protein
MKRLEDWSRNELLNMTDEQRAELADLECAYEGIPLLPLRPVKPEVKYPEKDVEIYHVDNFDFTSLDEAQAYVAFVSGLTSIVTLDYDYNTGSYDSKYIKKERLPKFDIEKKSAYCAETYAELRSEIVRAKAIETTYSEQASKYKKSRDERNSIYERIDSAVSEAWELKQREDTLTAAFGKYVTLAGDREIALKLLQDAYKVTPEEQGAVLAACAE